VWKARQTGKTVGRQVFIDTDKKLIEAFRRSGSDGLALNNRHVPLMVIGTWYNFHEIP
jgi:hypothetical protein